MIIGNQDNFAVDVRIDYRTSPNRNGLVGSIRYLVAGRPFGRDDFAASVLACTVDRWGSILTDMKSSPRNAVVCQEDSTEDILYHLAGVLQLAGGSQGRAISSLSSLPSKQIYQYILAPDGDELFDDGSLVAALPTTQGDFRIVAGTIDETTFRGCFVSCVVSAGALRYILESGTIWLDACPTSLCQ